MHIYDLTLQQFVGKQGKKMRMRALGLTVASYRAR